jgi:hypothetical protein
MDVANSYSNTKSASASIAFFHKINLFTNHSTGAPEVCMDRTIAARKFGLSPKRVKEPFLWTQLGDFALLYDIHNQGYCHLVVTTMAILYFRAICRYIDVSRLNRGNVEFAPGLSFLAITFVIRKAINFVKVMKLPLQLPMTSFILYTCYSNLKIVMCIIHQTTLSFVFLNDGWFRRVLIKPPLHLYLLSITNTFVTFHFGLEKYLGIELRNSKLYMVLDPVEVGVLQQLIMRVYLLNFGANMMIGRLIKAKNVT